MATEFYPVSQKHGVEKHSVCTMYVVKSEVSYGFSKFNACQVTFTFSVVSPFRIKT
jgi:hypothetical protein